MIRIHRPTNVPAVLLTRGLARRREHELDVESDPDSFSSGATKLTFDQTVYAHKTVKDELVAMQHGKCAFCEATPLAVSDGDVEHFRPKGGVQQTDDDPLERPGYYWLAYDWMNLMLSCGRCNQRHKKNLFPLFDPARRAKTPQDTIAGEDPVLIDPSAEDPEQHISYREHVPIAVRGSVRGEQTIEALGLRRPELNADREKHLAQVRILHATASIPGVPDELRTQALASLADVTSPASKYSLMCRAALGAQLLAPVEPASTAPQRI